MWSRAASFGAPVTDPGGKVASISSGHPTPGRSRPSTVLTRCTSPGCCSTASSDGTCTEPHSHTRPRSLRTRSTIITFSARSLARSSAATGGGALDGRRAHDATPARDRKRSGRGRRHVDAVAGQPHDRAERCRVALGQRRAEGGHVGAVGQRRAEPAGEVHLVHVAGGDGLADGGRRRPRTRSVEAARPRRLGHADPRAAPATGRPAGRSRSGRTRARPRTG